MTIRAGVHAGEIEVHDDGDISGIAVNLAARVEQAAADGELWVSSTVRDMMLGGAAGFDERGEHELKGIDGCLETLRRPVVIPGSLGSEVIGASCCRSIDAMMCSCAQRSRWTPIPRRWFAGG